MSQNKSSTVDGKLFLNGRLHFGEYVGFKIKMEYNAQQRYFNVLGVQQGCVLGPTYAINYRESKFPIMTIRYDLSIWDLNISAALFCLQQTSILGKYFYKYKGNKSFTML